MAKGIIKQIFIDHWDAFTKEYGNNIRESVFHEVKKMMLPKCAAEVVKSWYLDKSKKEKFMPGIVAVIHTFGRDLKWNPHVHMLLTEGGMGEITAWKNVKFLPYEMLRKRWQKILLDAIESELGKAKFRSLKNKLYNRLGDGFYVYSKNEVKDSKGAAKYIGCVPTGRIF